MRSIEIKAEPSGKPILFGTEAHVALAHSGGVLALYVGPENAGIDIELIKGRKNAPEIAALLFSPIEAALCAEGGASGLARFYRAWTEREATLKRHGLGVMDSFPSGSPDSRETRHWRIAGAKEYALCLSAPATTLERVEIRTLSDAGIAPASLKDWAPETGCH